MNKKKAGELLGKFWSEMPESVMLDESIYMIDYFIEWLDKEGFEIAPKEFAGTKSSEVDK